MLCIYMGISHSPNASRAMGLPDQPVLPDQGALIEPIRCLRCNGKMRPAVVWYGEDLPAQSWKTAVQLDKSCDVLISVDTSGVVMPAAGLPELALAAGTDLVNIGMCSSDLKCIRLKYWIGVTLTY